MTNKALCEAAVNAITDSSVEGKPGYCQRFVRQAVQRVHGNKFDPYFKASAKETAHALLQAELALYASEAGALQPGDVLYKVTGSGPYGHVGIYIDDQRVAENSSTRLGRISAAKGYRTLAQWGPPQVVFRIETAPPAADEYTLVLSGKTICKMPVVEGHALCPVRRWAEALGFDVDWNEETKQVLFDGRPVAAPMKLIGSTGHIPIRDLAQAVGLHLEVDAQTKTIRVN